MGKSSNHHGDFVGWKRGPWRYTASLLTHIGTGGLVSWSKVWDFGDPYIGWFKKTAQGKPGLL